MCCVLNMFVVGTVVSMCCAQNVILLYCVFKFFTQISNLNFIVLC